MCWSIGEFKSQTALPHSGHHSATFCNSGKKKKRERRKHTLWIALLSTKGWLLGRPGRAPSRWGSDSTPLIIRNFPDQCLCLLWAVCSACRLRAQRSCWKLLLEATAYDVLRTKPLICVARSLVYFMLPFSSRTPREEGRCEPSCMEHWVHQALSLGPRMWWAHTGKFIAPFPGCGSWEG